MTAIGNEMVAVDWNRLLDPLSTEEAWAAFKAKIMECEDKYIPWKKRVCNRKSKPVWMTYQAYKAVKKQYRVYAKYKNRNHPAYITASDRTKKLIKTARNNFEVKLAAKIKEDKKSFYAYLRSRTKTRTSHGPICSPDSSSPLSDKETANEFNKYFSSVFTKEDTSSIKFYWCYKHFMHTCRARPYVTLRICA